MLILLIIFYLVEYCIASSPVVSGIDFDSVLDIGFHSFLHPCSHSHLHENESNPHHLDSNLLRNSTLDRNKAALRLKANEAGNLLNELAKYDSFSSYLRTHYFKQSTKNVQSKNNEFQALWASGHSAPFAMFDHANKVTRLTWCQEDEKFQDEKYLIDSLRNRHIVFMGDSITRYQYLDLVYLLMYGKWSDDQKFVDSTLHKSWSDYLLYTAATLKNVELCECYRGVMGPGFANVENRKYVNQELNTTIWFFLWFGDYCLPHGHFNVSDDIRPMNCMPNRCTKAASKNPWMASSAADFIDAFVTVHSPDLVLLNTGFHTAFDGLNPLSHREAPRFTRFVRELNESGISTKFVFKSTTPYWLKPVADWRLRDLGAQKLGLAGVWKYWDISQSILELFTVYNRIELAHVYFNESAVSRGFHWDNYHYLPWINHEMNKLFIAQFFQ